MVKLDRDSHLCKISLSMFVTESGITMLVRAVQSEKAYSSIELTESGIVMLFKFLQQQNVSSWIVSIVLGIFILSRPVQLLNAPYPISSKVEGN